MDNEGMHSFSEIRIGLRSSENDLFEHFLWETMKKCRKINNTGAVNPRKSIFAIRDGRIAPIPFKFDF